MYFVSVCQAWGNKKAPPDRRQEVRDDEENQNKDAGFDHNDLE